VAWALMLYPVKMKRASRSPESDRSEAAPDEVASLQLIMAIGRSFKYVDDYVRPRTLKLGLTMTEFSVLNVLYQRGATPLGELSHRILLTGASTTYTVKKLEERGLLSRQPLKRDQRIVLGDITDAGRKLLERVRPIHVKDLVQAMGGLSVEEKRSVVSLLRKMRKPEQPGDV
jgi:MarR family 2-MHQ and catechol resistance regulon transcriptional repressor